MTLTEILGNEELRNYEFPITREKIFLAHAGVCPLPRRVVTAMRAYEDQCTLNDQETALAPAFFRDTRVVAARFLQCQAEEVALVGPTSLALSFVAGGLRTRRHQNIVIYHDDYPSNVYPWMTLADRGIEVRFLNIKEYGCIRIRDVLGQVDEQTRLVALASCHFISGHRIDLQGIAKALRERNILFCLDAIQTLGAFDTPARVVDFMAADSHKWMLGPCAAGILYARKESQDLVRPIAQGWHNLRSPNYVTLEELHYREDARRYEAGTQNIIGIVGLRAAMELLLEVGLKEIETELLRKRAWLLPAIQEKGWTVLNPGTSPEQSGPLISFYSENRSAAETHARLAQNSIVTSLRGDRTGRQYIRLAPHFYNTDKELQRVLDLL